MYNKKFLMLAILIIVLCVGFVGCDESSLGSLEGTTWVCSESEDGWSGTITLEFKPERKGVFTEEVVAYGKQKESYSFNFTYTYKRPNISIDIYVHDFYDYDITMNGVVRGNKMTFTVDEETMVFTKK